MSVEVRPLRPQDVDWLADLHNVAFADYAVPAVLDGAALRTYVEETDVDLSLSRVALVDDTPASFCLGALRGDRASIRGEGTVPVFRRQRLGRRVLDETLEALGAAGASSVCLEVLDGNDGAVNLYRKAGFEQTRRLLGYSLQRPGKTMRTRLSGGLAECDTGEALRMLEAFGWHDPPWQLEAASLAHLPAKRLDGRAVVLGKGRGDRFWLYAMAVDPAARRRGTATRALSLLPAGWIGVPALMPEEWWEAGALLRGLGALRESHWQWEMRRTL